MFLNKSKEITEKKDFPRLMLFPQHSLTPFVEEENIGSSLYQEKQWTPRFLVDRYF